jgi:hypothetical protein
VSRNIYLTDERYLAALKRFKQRIVDGRELEAWDDDSPGAKTTECTWGLCSEAPGDWERPVDMMWPRDKQRHTPKYTEKHHLCPLDRRTQEEATLTGCFYTCRIFKRERGQQPTTQAFVISLYDKRIEEAETRIKVFALTDEQRGCLELTAESLSRSTNPKDRDAATALRRMLAAAKEARING